jgi:cyclopropane-fatty-acyl-phospholipid synthase
MRGGLRDRLLAYLGARLAGEVPLRLVLWDGQRVDFAPAPKVELRLNNPHLARRLFFGDIAGLGEAYSKGEIEIEGRLADMIAVGVAIAERIGRSPLARRLSPLLARLPRHTKARDRAAIAHHYDVSNEFYRLWLDRRMVYSCAYFRTGEEDLDTAQEQKLDHICRKLRLAPGERLLDIGCGWGGLVMWAASRYGVEALGVTLSKRQAKHAREAVVAAGLERCVEVRRGDYRDIAGEAQFDKIVSVGMYEHVGIGNLTLYFRTIARLLQPGGLALNHGITSADRAGRAQGPPGGEFIDRLVFPGGELPHISKVLYAAAGAGLELLDVEDLRPHYPQTLLRWVARLEASRAAAIAAAGVERYRIWRMYMPAWPMPSTAASSRSRRCSRKSRRPRVRRRAPGRDYQYREDAASPLTRPLDWGDL